MRDIQFSLPQPSREWRQLSEGELEVILAYQKDPKIKVSDICKSLGIEIVSAPLPTSVSGEIRPHPLEANRYKIKVNRYEPETRQRFTAAHELAHFFLHKDEIRGGIVDTVMYRSNLSSILEAQANRLAADILMPVKLLEEQIDNLPEAMDVDDAAGVLAAIFGVSKIAMKYRLGLD
jgi:hypothetical protein